MDLDGSTGLFSGYAWSESVGWISFGDFDFDGDIDSDDKNISGAPCAPNCEAVLDLGTAEVSGWARASSPVSVRYENFSVPAPSCSFPFGGTHWKYQTFTVGAVGPNLDHTSDYISLWIGRSGLPGDVFIDVYDVAFDIWGSYPDLSSLRCSAVINGNDLSWIAPGWTDINLSSGCDFAANTEYAFMIRVSGGGDISWYFPCGSPPDYLGGHSGYSNDAGASWQILSSSLFFELWKGKPRVDTGWDGWIKLKGSSYGVTLNSIPDPSEFEGWAWSDNVIGWISFNCNNPESGDVCGASDYKVMTGFALNVPPEAAISCSPPTCSVYDSEILVLENSSTDADGNSDIVKSEWFINGVSKLACISSPLCNFVPQNYVGIGSYTAELYVEDLAGESDTITEAFQIKRDISVAFSCSRDNILWEVCEDITPMKDEAVYFRDESIASEGAVINSYVWEKDSSPFGGNNSNPGTNAVVPSMNIKLTVTDNAGRSASTSHVIGASISLPIWREIPPF